MRSRSAASAASVERVALVGSERAVALQELRVTDDAVERRAQLVAHIGEELALGARRGFGRFLRQPQLVLVLQAAEMSRTNAPRRSPGRRALVS